MIVHSTVILISVGLENFTFCSFNSHEEIMSNSSLKVNIWHHDFMAIKTADWQVCWRRKHSMILISVGLVNCTRYAMCQIFTSLSQVNWDKILTISTLLKCMLSENNVHTLCFVFLLDCLTKQVFNIKESFIPREKFTRRKKRRCQRNMQSSRMSCPRVLF